MAEVSSSPSEILDQLQQETLRLIKVQRLMYEKLLEDPELLEESNPDQSLDRARVRSALEQLDGEAAKVTNYEMVLAVVGTMKAGKSTCINAIVGTEVLPNRSEPMTAIPTLIRHVKGQVEPKLRMQNPEPLVKLVREIAQNLKDQNVLRSPEYIEISGTPDGKELIATVLRGKGLLFDGEHVGPDQIFSFLKGLNDLVRLSGAVGIPFPFDEYNEMDEYPVIEVEYFHLRDQDVGKGSFTILDTPGPNEAGNPHLKVMLRDQLKKASALLAVVDYTQVKSEADTDVRDQLLETIALVKCRAYVLVNKYDQKDRNDKRTVDQLRAQIAQDRLSGKVSSDVVFPVSARRAYLSNRMLNFLAHDGSMPDELSGWMEDFVSEAFGTSFDPEEIQDAEEVSRRAKRLWDRSGFSEPVRNVVRSSFEQAELMSMEAASNKIENLAKTMSNLLEVREGGVSLDVEKVQALIRSLSEDSSTLASLRKDVEERVREAAKEVGSHVKKAESKSRKQLAKSLEKFFKEGRSIAAESRELVKQQRLSEEKAIAERRESFRDDAPLKTFGKLLGFLAKIPVNHGSKVVVGETDILWDPANPVVVLAENERDKLNSLLKRILKETNKLVELANEAFESDIRILVHELEAGIQGEFQATGDSIKQAVDKHTKNAGINLDFQLPKLPRFDVDVQVKHIVESSVDEEKLNEERTRQVRRDSVGGKLKRGLGSLFGQSDWGYDTQTYFVEKTNLRLDLGQMRESLLQEVHESFSGLESNVNKYLKEDLGSRLDGYFKELDVRVRQIQGDLARSMGDRGKEKAVLSEFLARLKKMKSKSGNVASEAATLVNQIQGKVRLVRSTSP